jgi:hypothetical protein
LSHLLGGEDLPGWAKSPELVAKVALGPGFSYLFGFATSLSDSFKF